MSDQVNNQKPGLEWFWDSNDKKEDNTPIARSKWRILPQKTAEVRRKYDDIIRKACDYGIKISQKGYSGSPPDLFKMCLQRWQLFVLGNDPKIFDYACGYGALKNPKGEFEYFNPVLFALDLHRLRAKINEVTKFYRQALPENTYIQSPEFTATEAEDWIQENLRDIFGQIGDWVYKTFGVLCFHYGSDSDHFPANTSIELDPETLFDGCTERITDAPGNESFLGFFKKWWEEDPISYWHIAPKKSFKTTLRDESVLYAGHDTMQNAIAEFTARANEVPFTIDPSSKDPIRIKDRSVLKTKLVLQRYIFSPKDINVTKKNSDGSIEIRWKTTPELESNDDISVEEMISMCGRRTTNPDNRLYSDRQKAIAALTNCGSFPRADVVEPIAKEKFLCGYSFELELASFSHRPSNAQISEWNKAISAQHLKYHVTWYERADQDDVVLCIAEIV
jgi:hypothetical protein